MGKTRRTYLVALGLVLLMLVYVTVGFVFPKHPESSSASSSQQPNFLRRNYVTCQTSKGPFTVQLDHDAAPNSVRQFLRLVDSGFFNKIAFFRVNESITQFGVRGRGVEPKVTSEWTRDLNKEPVRELRAPWKRGVFALIGGTHMIIVKRDSTVMGQNNHDTVAGWVDEQGMQTIDSLFAYNDVINNPKGGGPDQRALYAEGWAYLDRDYPKVDYITSCQ
ncbi:hypothetical protein BASA81_011010 [Batrachochytrium salamandrivorans]|nr:hypothetical protein BASA81_011010 [Batrachochytrium salamandrivorans]